MQHLQADTPHLVLFTNNGKLLPTSEEEARQIHNATAGNPAGVAAAQALGDLSHLVYVPSWRMDRRDHVHGSVDER